jgi:hypothetical protein
MKHGFSKQAEKKPDRALVGRVRAALILRGTTLAHWADEHNVSRGCAHNAISGRRSGARSKSLRNLLLADLGISTDVYGTAHARKATPAAGGRQR